MNMRGTLNKPKTKPNEQKKRVSKADQGLKKELLFTIALFTIA